MWDDLAKLCMLDLRFQSEPAIMLDVEENVLELQLWTMDLVILFRRMKADFCITFI